MNTPSPMPYSPPRRPRSSARGWVFLLVAVAVGGGIWFGLSKPAAKEKSGPPPVSVRVAPVVQQSVPRTIQAVGTAVAYESVAIRARIDSQVVDVKFRDGDAVKKGDLLFLLDDKALRAQAEQLAANIARDRAQLENAKRQYDRATTLATKGFATKATRDDALANYESARATVGASVAALENIKVQLSYTRVTAPISGRTGTINVTVGNTVKANDAATALVTINQLQPIRVQAALPQSDFDAVREAMRAGKVAVTASKQDDAAVKNALAHGTLDYIDNAVDQATGTFITRAGFANADERLWPGMFVTLSLTLGSDVDALTIPEVAVQHGQTGDYAFVIADGKAAKRDIKVVRLQNGVAVVASGLSAGDTVAIDGMLGLKDGTPVSVIADATPAAAATTSTP